MQPFDDHKACGVRSTTLAPTPRVLFCLSDIFLARFAQRRTIGPLTQSLRPCPTPQSTGCLPGTTCAATRCPGSTGVDGQCGLGDKCCAATTRVKAAGESCPADDPAEVDCQIGKPAASPCLAADCAACPVGKVSLGGDCDLCDEPGTVANPTKTACMKCKAGRFPKADRSACDQCPDGMIANVPGRAREAEGSRGFARTPWASSY